MDTHHLLHRYREGVEGIVVTQVLLLGGAGKLAQIAQLTEITRVNPRRVELTAVHRDIFIGGVLNIHFRRLFAKPVIRHAMRVQSDLILLLSLSFCRALAGQLAHTRSRIIGNALTHANTHRTQRITSIASFQLQRWRPALTAHRSSPAGDLKR